MEPTGGGSGGGVARWRRQLAAVLEVLAVLVGGGLLARAVSNSVGLAGARALINAPGILLADEPTGNLDSKTGKTILHVLKGFHRGGQTILMVTHDSAIAAAADRILHLQDGRLTEGSP